MKKILLWLGVAFLVFYLFAHPTGAAHALRGAATALGSGFSTFGKFASALFS